MNIVRITYEITGHRDVPEREFVVVMEAWAQWIDPSSQAIVSISTSNFETRDYPVNVGEFSEEDAVGLACVYWEEIAGRFRDGLPIEKPDDHRDLLMWFAQKEGE